MNEGADILADVARGIILSGFEPHFGFPRRQFSDHEAWLRVREAGSKLWLDTGDLDGARALWSPSFSAMTTNNTLLNRQVQTGRYDDLIAKAASEIRQAAPEVNERVLIREIAFILNAYHGLRLVEAFDAFVSVELHTDLACNIEGAVAYAQRYHEICPERFIVKIPLTAEGLVAAARCSAVGVPINLTLGFSARHNLLVATVTKCDYCNVFCGRLNQVVADNHLGSGQWVGEKAVAGSQCVVADLRRRGISDTRQIAASLRSGDQVTALAGVDVLTLPPEAASEFLSSQPTDLSPGVERPFEPVWADDDTIDAYGLSTLWDIPDRLPATADEIAQMDMAHIDGGVIRRVLDARGLQDVLGVWTDRDAERAAADGKIPQLAAWRYRLAARQIGLDAVMTLSGLLSFAADQKAMDDRISSHLPKAG